MDRSYWRTAEPSGATANVSSLAPAQQDGRIVRAQFTIRAEQRGRATIKAGFVARIDNNRYGRMPGRSTLDGSIQINIIE